MNSPLTSTAAVEIEAGSSLLQDQQDACIETTVVHAEVVQSGTEIEIQDPNAAAAKLAEELRNFQAVASRMREELMAAVTFDDRCKQAFDHANDLFANAPTWVCFFREMLASDGVTKKVLFHKPSEYDSFLGSKEYSQILKMLTALRSRELPENDPNDPQRMITVRLPKSLHEALCDEAERLNISVNKLCISRMLQLLDPAMIPETGSKPRGRKPRTRTQTGG